jgi:cytoskeletal protein CcmA (bactofilin family)
VCTKEHQKYSHFLFPFFPFWCILFVYIFFSYFMFRKTVQDQPYQAPMVAQQAQDDVETVVGPSVVVEGDFASDGNILVKGTVSGNVTTSRVLRVEDGAKILANVKAGEALISGHIKGNVRVADRLELTETAQIVGDIQCQTLVVAPGAVIQGKLSMRGVLEDAPVKSERSSRASRAREEMVTPSEE